MLRWPTLALRRAEFAGLPNCSQRAAKAGRRFLVPKCTCSKIDRSFPSRSYPYLPSYITKGSHAISHFTLARPSRIPAHQLLTHTLPLLILPCRHRIDALRYTTHTHTLTHIYSRTLSRTQPPPPTAALRIPAACLCARACVCLLTTVVPACICIWTPTRARSESIQNIASLLPPLPRTLVTAAQRCTLQVNPLESHIRS